MLSAKLAYLNGLILVLITGITSGMGAFALAQAPDLSAGPAIGKAYEMNGEPLAGETWRRTELYFGTEKPDGSAVTPQEFDDFMDEIITPRFPDGLTLLSGDGQWRDSTGTIIEEESNMLILLYPLGESSEAFWISSAAHAKSSSDRGGLGEVL